MFEGANLALRFAPELAALAALALWGAQATSSTLANVALALAAPVAAIWAVWSAPRAPRRLHGRALVLLELAILAVSGIALAAAGHLLLACALVAIALVNGVILRRGQSHA
ncbi:MAG: hypothetical protein QOI43_2238 [Gaiellales bacterium]|nr:hypothetical protein [Gaiellales bacterium]